MSKRAVWFIPAEDGKVQLAELISVDSESRQGRRASSPPLVSIMGVRKAPANKQAPSEAAVTCRPARPGPVCAGR